MVTQLVKTPPQGEEWLHEIKFDGYRMHARLERGDVRLLTRKGLDWTHKYPTIAEALKTLAVSQAYLDGELCGVRPDGTTSFDMLQAAAHLGREAVLVFFLFDLLYLDNADLTGRPLIERKTQFMPMLRYHGGQADLGSIVLDMVEAGDRSGLVLGFMREIAEAAWLGTLTREWLEKENRPPDGAA